MGKIQKLPESLIRLIAAGEVVERPASVVKELVENSLDAGASKISIDIWGAGRTRIRISDDGEGMTRADAEQALDRHATSKLRVFDDLSRLSTFGFRGEALPSIAAVSRFDLSTRNQQTPDGWQMLLEGGTVLSSRTVGIPIGTTIDVKDLFFNTPARLKFLKRESTERTHILRTIEEMAIAHPQVSFEVAIDGKSVLRLGRCKDLASRLGDIWGLSVADRLKALDIRQGPCQINGFVNNVPSHHPTKAYQILFVNHRPVQQRMLTYAIYEAYREWLPVGRHPVFALFINIDPNLVDVNVHPTKREVRFADERALSELLHTKIRELFKAAVGSPVFGQNPGFNRPVRPTGETIEAALSIFSPSPSSTLGGAGLAERVADAPLPFLAESPFDVSNIQYLGQFQKLYLLVARGEELLIIDQHAAAERVHYERLIHEAQNPSSSRQRLLVPVLLEMSAAQANSAQAYLQEFDALGFGVEMFGPTTLALKEWPAHLPEARQAQRFLEETIEQLNREQPPNRTAIQHEIAARAACRTAVMANDSMDSNEVLQLLQDLAKCERPMTCPHGRPTHVRLPLAELHRRFRRT